MSKVKIKLQPGKPMEIKVEGAPGSDCRVASAPYEKALRGKVISDTPTAEANLPSATVTGGIGQQIGN